MTKKLVFMTHFGSDLYGTRRRESDSDWRGVVMPSGRDILMQRVGETSKLRPDNLGVEAEDYFDYTFHHFLKMFTEGDPQAMDMGFAPEEFWVKDHTDMVIWGEFIALRPQLLSKNINRYLSYCKNVVDSYGIRADRHETAKKALAIAETAVINYGGQSKAVRAFDALKALDARFVTVDDTTYPSVTTVYVCGSGVQSTHTIDMMHRQFASLNRAYGFRAEKASTANKRDYKALHHAVRLAEQGLEFVQTHAITFPRANSEYLLAIKQERVDYNDTVDHLIRTYNEMLVQHKACTLPDVVDPDVVSDFILRVYKKAAQSY